MASIAEFEQDLMQEKIRSWVAAKGLGKAFSRRVLVSTILFMSHRRLATIIGRKNRNKHLIYTGSGPEL